MFLHSAAQLASRLFHTGLVAVPSSVNVFGYTAEIVMEAGNRVRWESHTSVVLVHVSLPEAGWWVKVPCIAYQQGDETMNREHGPLPKIYRSLLISQNNQC